MAENFANEYQATLSGAIDASQTSIVVASAAGAPAANFRLRIDSEYMLVTAVAGTTFTVTRGVEGSTAASHADGATVTHVLTAGGLTTAISEGGATRLAPTSDTMIQGASRSPASNFDTSDTLGIGDDEAGNDWQMKALFTFDVSILSLPVTRASLRVCVTSVSNALDTDVGLPFYVREVLRAYGPTTVTWNEYDTGLAWSSVGARGIGTDVSTARYGTRNLERLATDGAAWVDFDVTELVQQALVAAKTTLRLILVSGRPTIGQNNIWIGSSENTDANLRPVLSVG